MSSKSGPLAAYNYLLYAYGHSEYLILKCQYLHRVADPGLIIKVYENLFWENLKKICSSGFIQIKTVFFVLNTQIILYYNNLSEHLAGYRWSTTGVQVKYFSHPYSPQKKKILRQPTTVTELGFRMSLGGLRGIKIETVIVGYCECPRHM